MKGSLFALCGAALLLGACAREPDFVVPEAAPPASPAARVPVRIVNFALGTKVGPYGGIVPGATKYAFEPGELIYVAMQIESAPLDLPIQVIWRGPGQEVLGQDMKLVRRGQRFMFFVADSANLPSGEDYGVEIIVNGQVLTSLQFDVLETITVS